MEGKIINEYDVVTDMTSELDEQLIADTIATYRSTDAVDRTPPSDAEIVIVAMPPSNAEITIVTTPPSDAEIAIVVTPPSDTEIAGDAMRTSNAVIPGLPLTLNSKGSGDAMEFLRQMEPTLTVEDFQDMILPSSIMDLLPPLVMREQIPDLSENYLLQRTSSYTLKEEYTSNRIEDQENIAERITPPKIPPEVPPGDKLEILNSDPEEENDSENCLVNLQDIICCEACLELLMSSEAIHTCEFGHQFCENCYKFEVFRTCHICNGHLHYNNTVLENAMRRLRENCPELSIKETSTFIEEEDIDSVSTFYSLKPVECPEDGCKYQIFARSVLTHFKKEHSYIPLVVVTFLETIKVVLPESLENMNGKVMSVINLKIPEEYSCRLFGDIVTCWIQCGTTKVDEDEALLVWVSCAYESYNMPLFLYNLRVATADGYCDFSGQMVPLHDYKDIDSIKACGRYMLLYHKYLQDLQTSTYSVNEENLVVELTFYP